MLIAADITTGARILLNELVEAFWYSADFDEWNRQAALDISAKTYCYEVKESVTLISGQQEYAIVTDHLKILGAKYADEPKGLYRFTPWMEGLQEVSIPGKPKYFYDFARMFGVVPIPSAAEDGGVITLFCASTTNTIANIPNAYRTCAVLFVTGMGLLKERQYAKAGSMFQIYAEMINLARTDNVSVKVSPPPLDSYVLKATAGAPTNAS